MEKIAKQLPMRMLGRLLGVPDDDGPWLVERGDALLGNFDPEFTDTPLGLTDTETPLCSAAPEFGSMRSTVASTASKFDPNS